MGNYYVMGGSGRVINPASTTILARPSRTPPTCALVLHAQALSGVVAKWWAGALTLPYEFRCWHWAWT